MPSRRRVRMTLTAISPRLAMSTVWNTFTSGRRRRRPGQRGVRTRRERQAEDRAGVGGGDDAVVPEPCRRVVRVALLLVLGPDRLLEGVFLVGAPRVTELIPADGGEDGRRLIAAHHGDAGVGPHEEEAGGVGPAAHRVVAGA